LLEIQPLQRADVTRFDLFKSFWDHLIMKAGFVRTSIDLPRDIHRRLHEAAAHKGCSARQLILNSIEHLVAQSQPARPRRRLRLDPPLIPPAGRHLDLTNEQIYELINLP
jgi:hypothetical protein